MHCNKKIVKNSLKASILGAQAVEGHQS